MGKWVVYIALLLVLASVLYIPHVSKGKDITLVALPGNVTNISNAHYVKAYVSNVMNLTIVLKPKSPLEPWIANLTGINGTHKWLSLKEISRLFGSEVEYQSVADYFSSYGLKVHPLGIPLFLKVEGTSINIARALHVEFNVYMHLNTLYYNSTPPVLPYNIASCIESIYGLSNYSLIVPLVKSSPKPLNSPPYNVSQIENAYNITPVKNKGDYGNGKNIVIISSGEPSMVDIDAFFKMMNETPPHYNFIYVDGSSSPPNSLNDNSLETTLDTEWAGAIANGSTINVLLSPGINSQFFTDMFIYAVTHFPGGIVSVSWGSSENNTGSALLSGNNEIISIGILEGMSFFASSGDYGAYDMMPYPSVNFWASSPYVTAVGGTSLIASLNGSWIKEIGWDGSGGGISYYFPQPFYQYGLGIPLNGHRNVPDVAYDASPSTSFDLIWDSQLIGVGGTSAGSPQWAAIWALAESHFSYTLGFPNPYIYQIARSSMYNSTFHDITVGYNYYYDNHIGWNFVDGWGTPKVEGLINALASLPTFNARAHITLSSTIVPSIVNLTAVSYNQTGAVSYSWNITNLGVFHGSTLSITINVAGTYIVVLNATEGRGEVYTYVSQFTLSAPSYMHFNISPLYGELYIDNSTYPANQNNFSIKIPSGLHLVSYYEVGFTPYINYVLTQTNETVLINISLKKGNNIDIAPYGNYTYFSPLNSFNELNQWSATYNGGENSTYYSSAMGYSTLFYGNNVYLGGNSYTTSLINVGKYYTNLTNSPVLVTVNNLYHSQIPSNGLLQMGIGIQDIYNFNYLEIGFNLTNGSSTMYVEEGLYSASSNSWKNYYIYTSQIFLPSLSFAYFANGTLEIWNGSHIQRFALFNEQLTANIMQNISLVLYTSYKGYGNVISSFDGIGMYNMTGSVRGVVLSQQNNLPVQNAKISIGNANIQANSNGIFYLPSLPYGYNALKSSAFGYYTYISKIFVGFQNVTNVTIYMVQLNTVYLSGNVLSSQTHEPIVGAILVVNNVVLGVSGINGFFMIYIPIGTFVITISASSYKSLQETLTVNNNKTGVIFYLTPIIVYSMPLVGTKWVEVGSVIIWVSILGSVVYILAADWENKKHKELQEWFKKL